MPFLRFLVGLSDVLDVCVLPCMGQIAKLLLKQSKATILKEEKEVINESTGIESSVYKSGPQ